MIKKLFIFLFLFFLVSFFGSEGRKSSSESQENDLEKLVLLKENISEEKACKIAARIFWISNPKFNGNYLNFFQTIKTYYSKLHKERIKNYITEFFLRDLPYSTIATYLYFCCIQNEDLFIKYTEQYTPKDCMFNKKDAVAFLDKLKTSDLTYIFGTKELEKKIGEMDIIYTFENSDFYDNTDGNGLLYVVFNMITPEDFETRMNEIESKTKNFSSIFLNIFKYIKSIFTTENHLKIFAKETFDDFFKSEKNNGISFPDYATNLLKTTPLMILVGQLLSQMDNTKEIVSSVKENVFQVGSALKEGAHGIKNFIKSNTVENPNTQNNTTAAPTTTPILKQEIIPQENTANPAISDKVLEKIYTETSKQTEQKKYSTANQDKIIKNNPYELEKVFTEIYRDNKTAITSTQKDENKTLENVYKKTAAATENKVTPNTEELDKIYKDISASVIQESNNTFENELGDLLINFYLEKNPEQKKQLFINFLQKALSDIKQSYNFLKNNILTKTFVTESTPYRELPEFKKLIEEYLLYQTAIAAQIFSEKKTYDSFVQFIDKALPRATTIYGKTNIQRMISSDLFKQTYDTMLKNISEKEIQTKATLQLSNLKSKIQVQARL